MFSAGDEFTLASGTKGVVRWVNRLADGHATAVSWGEDMVTVELRQHKGRRHWTELTEFRESDLRARLA